MIKKYLYKHKKNFSLVIFLSIITKVTSIFLPLVFMSIIDRVIPGEAYKTLYVIIFAIICVAIFDFCISLAEDYVYNWNSAVISSGMFVEYFNKILKVDSSYFQKYDYGDIISRTSELERLKKYSISWLTNTSIDLIFMFVFLTILANINIMLTSIIIFFVPFHFLQYYIFSRSIKHRNDNVFKTNVIYNRALVESVRGIETIRQLSAEEKISRNLYKNLNLNLRNKFKLSLLHIYSNKISAFLSRLLDAIILLVGSISVMEANISLGEFVAFILLKDKVLQPLLSIASIWEEITQYRLSRDRVKTTMDYRVENRSGNQLVSKNFNIIFNNVTFSYDTKPVIQNMNLNVKSNRFTCIVGESGIGKSTMFKLLNRYYDNFQGEILISGINIKELELEALRKMISYVGQETRFFAGTIRENILISSLRTDEKWLNHCTSLACISDLIESLPYGYDTKIDNWSLSFSGGQLQRLSIARCLASDSSIMILDEATSALDNKTESKVLDNLLSYCKGKTIVAISHRMSLAKRADYIVCLNKEKEIQYGTHYELMKKCEYYRSINY
ncbi:TPA: peptidase domain-containing ABC transporter [Vibrio vulnificus]|nr:peptidase domain-containing ABC transporter [Vibrio vulnificus]